MSRSRLLPPPSESAITSWYADADLVDSYSIPLPPGYSKDVKVLARTVLPHPSRRFLVTTLGWRGACLSYAGVQIAVSLPIYLVGLPREPAGTAVTSPPFVPDGRLGPPPSP